MSAYEGTLAPHLGTGEPTRARFVIDDGWVRVVVGYRPLGTWRVSDIACERVSLTRFTVKLDADAYTFIPDDPAAFSDAIGAVVDLRSTARFGLGPRVRAALAADRDERGPDPVVPPPG